MTQLPAGSIEAVSLDLDGTLYSIRSMILRNLPAIWSMRPLFKTLHRVRDGMRGLEPVGDFRAEQARRLAEATGLDLDEAMRRVEEIIDRRWPAVFTRVRPYRGLVECLVALRRHGVQLAICSDYPIEAKLAGLGLSTLPFASKVNAEDCGALKPHPAAFLRVCRELGCAPDRVLHIGDLEDNDVAGALAAGMRAALFRPGRGRAASRAHLIFRRWSGLIDQLRAMVWLAGPAA